MLKNADCDVSLYKILDYEEAGWFYHAPFRSCRPFYAANRERCQQNRDLPLTKEECEDICGELFTFSHENLNAILKIFHFTTFQLVFKFYLVQFQ